jgi:anti-anti-sigma factor
MPKLSSRIQEKRVAEGREETFFHVTFSGFVDAANYASFEKCLEDVYAKGGRFAAADFSDLHYINSTGISALIRFYGLYKDRGGVFCLASVPKPVGLSMHLLGVTSLIPFLKDVEAARQHFIAHLEGRLPSRPLEVEVHGEGPQGEPTVEKVPVTVQRPREDLANARILLVYPQKGRFSRILRRRFNRLDGRFILLHDIKEALDRYDELNPDLVVLDCRLDPKGEFVTRVKINKDRSLTSIIKLYERATDVEGEIDFKIWENDYLIDPFELLELFSLTEAELRRVPRDRKVFQQQLHFEFRCNPANVEKANKLSDLVIRQAIKDEEDRTALFAAVKEAIDNGVIHGNRRSAALTIDVNFLVDNRKVTVIVEDQGKGFDFEYYLSRIDSREAFEKAKRRIMDEGHRGGLGILLMHKCCDRLEYSGNGNVVRLEKNLERSAIRPGKEAHAGG